MARQEHTPEKFEAIANELLEASNTLKSLAELMRSHNMPFALIHGTTSQNFHLPAVLDWVGKTNVDTRTQVRAFVAGVQSKAELQKKYTDNAPYPPQNERRTSEHSLKCPQNFRFGLR